MKTLIISLFIIALCGIIKASDKEEVLTELIYNEQRALIWLRADYTRDMSQVYGETKQTRQAVWHVVNKYETELQEKLYEFYSKTFSKEELILLAAPYNWIKPSVLRKIFKARKSKKIIKSDSEFFNKLAYEITDILDSKHETETFVRKKEWSQMSELN